MPRNLDRRQLLRASLGGLGTMGLGTMGLGGLGALGLPFPVARAQPGATGKKLLVVFCYGGWDPTYFFAPDTDPSVIDGDPYGAAASAGGIPFVDSSERPTARSFMDAWGGSMCFLNGIEVHSVAHTVCVREMITGHLHTDQPDWVTLVARETGEDSLMPLLHFSGPSFPQDASGSVVRVGANRQLPRLLDGSALTEASPSLDLLSEKLQAIEDAHVTQRLEALSEQASRGRAQVLLERALLADARRGGLANTAALGLDTAEDLTGKGLVIVDALEAGLARCGMIQHDGWGSFGWDTHGDNHQQSKHFEDLFEQLDPVIAALAQRAGSSGGSLLDETLVAVISEMGRFPKLNLREGKEHWTFTSAMLIGGGVKGGQVIGGYDDGFEGLAIDPELGTLASDGIVPTSGHLGATLLTACGIDSEPWFPDAVPIRAALDL